MLDAIQSRGGVNLPFSDIGSFISTVLRGYIFYAAGIVLLVYLIIGGLRMMTSAGNPKGFEGGKMQVANALIGFVIVFAAYWITRIIEQIFGLTSVFQ